MNDDVKIAFAILMIAKAKIKYGFAQNASARDMTGFSVLESSPNAIAFDIIGSVRRSTREFILRYEYESDNEWANRVSHIANSIFEMILQDSVFSENNKRTIDRMNELTSFNDTHEQQEIINLLERTLNQLNVR